MHELIKVFYTYEDKEVMKRPMPVGYIFLPIYAESNQAARVKRFEWPKKLLWRKSYRPSHMRQDIFSSIPMKRLVKR